MEISGTASSLWPRLHRGAPYHSELEVHGRPSLPLKQQPLQQELLLLQQQHQQRQQQMQALGHSSLLAMQELLRQTATAASADPGALPPPSDVFAMRPQPGSAAIMSPTTEGFHVLPQGGDIESRDKCSVSRGSSRTSSCSSHLPIIVESSSEAFSDSEEEAKSWTEVTLLGAEGGNREGPNTPPSSALLHRQAPPIHLSNAFCHREPIMRDSGDEPKSEGRLPRNFRGYRGGAASDAFSSQKQANINAEEPQKRRFTLIRRLVGAFTNKRKSFEPNASNKHPPSHPQDTATDPEASVAATHGIVALRMELLQLSREARRQRRRQCTTSEDADAPGHLSSSTHSSDSSSTSGTPRTGSSCSSSLRARPRRRRFSSGGCSRLRYTCSTTMPRRRSSSAPTRTTESRCLTAGRTQAQAAGGRHQNAMKPPFQKYSTRGPLTRTQNLASSQDGNTEVEVSGTAAQGSAATFDSTKDACKYPVRLDSRVKEAAKAAAAAPRERGMRRRELRAKEATSILQREKERRYLQRSALWWFASDILLPQL